MKAHIADVAASFSRWLATRTEGWTAHEKLALHARIAEALGAGPDPAAGNLGINVTLETYTSDGDAEYEQRGASTHLKINHGYMVLGFAHPGTDLAGRDVTELANVHIEHKTDRWELTFFPPDFADATLLVSISRDGEIETERLDNTFP